MARIKVEAYFSIYVLVKVVRSKSASALITPSPADIDCLLLDMHHRKSKDEMLCRSSCGYAISDELKFFYSKGGENGNQIVPGG